MKTRTRDPRRRERTKTLFIAVVSAGLIGTGGMLLWVSTLSIPDLQSFEQRRVAQSTKIYDRTGEALLYDVHENVRRTVVPLEDMSVHIKNATVALEDSEFYEHAGIKPAAILRAALVNLLSLEFEQGGSTITQQVVKNSVLTSEKTIARKLKEWVLSIKLERRLSKEQILELYLNEVPYGGNLYGIEEASQAYFDTSSAKLTLAEAAYLAALPKAPTFYSPYGNNKEALDARKNFALRQMRDNGFITPEEYGEAREEEVAFQPRFDLGIRAPHFVIFVRELLAEKYGERTLEEGGLRVTTTIDYQLQEAAQRILEKHARENEERFNAENAGLVAIDPKTGQILAMVGSRDYFDEEIDGNFNVALAHRQPGSAFKPFVYATALNKGFTPQTAVFDLRTQFSTACTPSDFSSENPCYSPVNYDSVFRGPVTFREALAQSINIPAVKVLYLSGLENARQLAENMGITSLEDINRYGLTLVLGGGEVSLFDMTSAYSVFANDGVRNPPAAILEVRDANGAVIDTFEERGRRVLPRETARQINDMLSDNEARTPAFGANSPLYFPGRTVAAKTGTTNNYRDAWVLGYTPTIAVGTWAGNNDNTSMEKRVAGFVVAPMWNEFMNVALARVPNEAFPPYDSSLDPDLNPMLRGFWRGGESYFVDSTTGDRATENTPPESREERVITNVHSLLYWVDKNNPTGPPPANPDRDPQFARWEYAVQMWKSAQGITDEDESVIPDAQDNVHTPDNAPDITIVNPKDGVTYDVDERIRVSLDTDSRFPFARAEFYVNGTYLGSANKAPFSITFVPNEVEDIAEENTLRVIGYDNIQNKGEAEALFRVASP